MLIVILVLSCVNFVNASNKGDMPLIFNVTCNSHGHENTENQSNCVSLEDISFIIEEQQLLDVQVNVWISETFLHSRIHFKDLNSLIINGEPALSTITCSTASSDNDTGIILSDIADVKINNLKLEFCGSKVFWERNNFASALTLFYCRNVDFSQLAILHSRGIGLMIVDHRRGSVSIESSVFIENNLPQDYTKDSVLGGGGVYISIYRIQPSYLPLHLQFKNCIFENNTAHANRYKYLLTNIFGEAEEGHGQGGGVQLSIVNSVNIHASFMNCIFKGNEAFMGGGLSVRIHAQKSSREVTNITVEVIDSLFNLNGCSGTNFTYFGGGAYFIFLNASSISDSHFLVKNVSFINNCAQYGGGIYYSSDRSEKAFKDSTRNTILLDNCTLKHNKAHMGSAVDINPTVFQKLLTGYTVYPTFRNCYFLGNYVVVNDTQRNGVNQKTAGLGTIRSSQHNIYFEKYNCFKHNKGSALYIFNGIVNCQKSNLTFVNNTALYGGAIALLGSSIITVGPNNYEFIRNVAFYAGGALHISLIDNFDLSISKNCFIQYADKNNVITHSSDWNANITFKDNYILHGNAGQTIYATSLHHCQFFMDKVNNRTQPALVNISQILSKRGITIVNDAKYQIATDGAVLHSSRNTPLTVIPGEKYEHGVTISDDLQQKSELLFRASLIHEGGSKNQNDHVDLDPSYSTFVGDIIQLTGEPKHNAVLFLSTVSPRGVYIGLDVTLLECPPGFKLTSTVNASSRNCVCNVNAYVGLFKCDSHNFRSYLLPGYWAGFITIHDNSEPVLVTATCPFCEYQINNFSDTPEYEVVLPRERSDLDMTVCGERRTGILCGKCREGYTVHFHSPDFLCKQLQDEPLECKLGWLFYILSELVPLSVVFVTVLVLNISFTSGGISGFILFSQLLDSFDINASGIIAIGQTAKVLTQIYQVIYGFFNINFFHTESLSFCLWKNASVLDMFAVKFITLLYILLLIGTVIWVMDKYGGKYCGKCCRITTIRLSVVHGISTFLIICYTKFVQVAIIILNPVHFNVEVNSGIHTPVHVWLNGEIR